MNPVQLKNYTSGVPAEKTISRIEELLARAGAVGIRKSYTEGVLKALEFAVEINKRQIVIRLPTSADAVYQTMLGQMKRPRASTLVRLQEQAQRTAWRLMQDWVEVQLSLIQMGQAEFLQVFLPYVWDGRQSFYAAIKGNDFKQRHA